MSSNINVLDVLLPQNTTSTIQGVYNGQSAKNVSRAKIIVDFAGVALRLSGADPAYRRLSKLGTPNVNLKSAVLSLGSPLKLFPQQFFVAVTFSTPDWIRSNRSISLVRKGDPRRGSRDNGYRGFRTLPGQQRPAQPLQHFHLRRRSQSTRNEHHVYRYRRKHRGRVLPGGSSRASGIPRKGSCPGQKAYLYRNGFSLSRRGASMQHLQQVRIYLCPVLPFPDLAWLYRVTRGLLRNICRSVHSRFRQLLG